jgi:hypothetical protein
MGFVTELPLLSKIPTTDSNSSLLEPPPAYAKSYHEAETGSLPLYSILPERKKPEKPNRPERKKPTSAAYCPDQKIPPGFRVINRTPTVRVNDPTGMMCLMIMIGIMMLTIIGVAIGVPIALAVHPPAKGGGSSGNLYTGLDNK